MPSKAQPPKTEIPEVAPAAPQAVADLPPTNASLIPKPKEATKEVKSNLKLAKVVRSYLVPLGVLAVFGGMLVFLVIPKISEIIGQLDQTNSLYDQARTIDTQLVALNNLNSQQAQFADDLSVINQIAPSSATEVVNFQTQILSMTKQNNLAVQQSTLEESVKQAQDKSSTANLGIIEIPSTFSLRGSFANLKAFVQQIQGLQDFVIIGEMALRSNADPNSIIGSGGTGANQDDWTLTITLIKYQFLTPNAQNQLGQVFNQISPLSQPNKAVLDFAHSKFTAQATPTTSSTSGDQTTGTTP